jgi:hypothetical protein
MAPAVATYEPRDPSRTVLYNVIAEHLETFLASLAPRRPQCQRLASIHRAQQFPLCPKNPLRPMSETSL